MKRSIVCFLIVIGAFASQAQLPYTDTLYDHSEELDVFYGTAVNFAGRTDSLFVDIYKPVGDSNCKRPLLIMIHGGAWISGSKLDPDVSWIAKQMAKRGYVVASVQYRLGTHKAAYYTPYALCNSYINPLGLNTCIYNYDTSEYIRANYRAMQDAKGALRFMKSRHMLDSSDINNAYAGGVSAGGFTALALAFMDKSSEKPSVCGAIDTVAVADADLYTCYVGTIDRSRPDLGSIDGDLHIGTYDATVKGVVNFFGGFFDPYIIDSTSDSIALYLYHNTTDVIVECRKRTVYQTLNGCISGICQPIYFRPWVHGGCAILDYLDSNSRPVILYDDVNNLGSPNCIASPPGHSIHGIGLRVERVSGFFASEIAKTGNHPDSNCIVASGLDQPELENGISIHPNPASDQFNVIIDGTFEKHDLKIIDITGKQRLLLSNVKSNNYHVDLDALEPGMYFIQIWFKDNGMVVKQLVKQ